MSDTRPIVSWTLERPCALRGTNCQDPYETWQKLAQVQSCAERLRSGDVVDGLWVTGTYWGEDAAGNRVNIPSSGMRINEPAEPFGGWGAVRKACHGCEANVAVDGEGIAGCHGSLEVMYPHSEEFESLLWDVIRLRGLEDRVREMFPITTPLWFGFWIESPLRRQQCELLLEILPYALPRLWGRDENGEACEPVFETRFFFSDFDPAAHYGAEFDTFFRALRASIQWELPLHVRMSTPGHVDLGFYTEFPHCPRCKAEAKVERWTQKVESSEYTCHVCGQIFDPATTYRSEECGGFDLGSLEQELGAEYDAFAIRYAESQGVTESQMREALDIHRDGPVLRDVARRRQRARELKRKFESVVDPACFDDLPETLILEVNTGVTIELVRIMPGEFLMGSNEREAPPHRVNIRQPFYLGKFPITQEQWLAIMGNNPSRCRGGLLPVEQITWLDAQDFCARLSEQVGRHVRLPSEAEWEYACRAGTTTRYWFGDEGSPELAHCDWQIKSPEDYFKVTESRRPQTVPVDQFRPNPWGLFDLHGNVNEWCDDSWHESYAGAPLDGSAWVDDDEPVDHALRGGAAYVCAAGCTSASRTSARAHCGSRPYRGEEEEISIWESLLSFTEYLGLRIACAAIAADLE